MFLMSEARGYLNVLDMHESFQWLCADVLVEDKFQSPEGTVKNKPPRHRWFDNGYDFLHKQLMTEAQANIHWVKRNEIRIHG